MIPHLTKKTPQGETTLMCRNPLLQQIKQHKVGLPAKGITQLKAIRQQLPGLLAMKA